MTPYVLCHVHFVRILDHRSEVSERVSTYIKLLSVTVSFLAAEQQAALLALVHPVINRIHTEYFSKKTGFSPNPKPQ